MILYFPKVKISRCDEVPTSLGKHYTFLLRAMVKTPAHYPKHALLEGKLELFGLMKEVSLIFDMEYKPFLLHCFNTVKPQQLKGKTLSILAEFDEDKSPILKWVGMGKVDELAFQFGNIKFEPTAIETSAKLHYDLSSKGKREKKTKI